VILERVPLGSLREEFLIQGRKFDLGRNCTGKAVDEKALSFYDIFIQHIKKLYEVGLDGNVYHTQGQAALTAVTDVIKDSVWFIIIDCFFTVGSVKFLQ